MGRKLLYVFGRDAILARCSESRLSHPVRAIIRSDSYRWSVRHIQSHTLYDGDQPDPAVQSPSRQIRKLVLLLRKHSKRTQLGSARALLILVCNHDLATSEAP